MLTTRRRFVQTTAMAGGALVLGAMGCSGSGDRVRPARNPLRILILGGTRFIGPTQVEYALRRGHTVTLFNRGRTNPHLFPELEKLIGDRNDDLETLRGREWDVVIDNPTTLPRWVRTVGEVLRDATDHFIFVSTLSVYADNSIIDQGETGELLTIDDPTIEQVTGTTYGPLKALSEQEAERAFPGRTTVVRPGLIVGPMDPSDRFTYWPVRVDRGGEVLAPGDGSDVVQFIDARDLGEWMITVAENQYFGIYNATGPEVPMPMMKMLTGMKDALGSDATFTWADAEWLAEQGVRPWSHMPVWFPEVEGMEGFSRFSIARALEKGLTFRPLAVTTRDTVEWHKTRPQEEQENMRAGLSAEREAEVLEAWHAAHPDA